MFTDYFQGYIFFLKRSSYFPLVCKPLVLKLYFSSKINFGTRHRITHCSEKLMLTCDRPLTPDLRDSSGMPAYRYTVKNGLDIYIQLHRQSWITVYTIQPKKLA